MFLALSLLRPHMACIFDEKHPLVIDDVIPLKYAIYRFFYRGRNSPLSECFESKKIRSIPMEQLYSIWSFGVAPSFTRDRFKIDSSPATAHTASPTRGFANVQPANGENLYPMKYIEQTAVLVQVHTMKGSSLFPFPRRSASVLHSSAANLRFQIDATGKIEIGFGIDAQFFFFFFFFWSQHHAKRDWVIVRLIQEVFETVDFYRMIYYIKNNYDLHTFLRVLSCKTLTRGINMLQN